LGTGGVFISGGDEMKTVLAGMALAAALAAPAAAKVTDQGPGGFTVALEGDISMTPDYAFARFVDIGSWWSDGHSFSGSARNMTITPQPGGCWCETLPNSGFVEHMRVVFADPGKMLVLKGGMGPLVFMGATGALTIKFEHKDEGTHVTLTFAVGGYDPGGWGDLSKAVDGVLAEQLGYYVANKARNP